MVLSINSANHKATYFNQLEHFAVTVCYHSYIGVNVELVSVAKKVDIPFYLVPSFACYFLLANRMVGRLRSSMDVDVETMVVHDYENGAAIPIKGELFHVSYLCILLVVCMLSVSRISHIPWKFIPHTEETQTSTKHVTLRLPL